MALKDLLELVRAPAVLTVLGDGIAGSTAAHGRVGRAGVSSAIASASLYAAGMALNDFADADLDQRERPERPIPSGRVSRGCALSVAAALTAGGLAAARGSGRRTARFAGPLAACVWFYDLVAKKTSLGPLAMAACRGLDVLMGAAGNGWRSAAVPAAAIAGHTLTVTTVSRGEVHGTSRAAAAGAAVASFGAAAAAVASGVRSGNKLRAGGAFVAAAAFLGAVLPGFFRAVREPNAENARTATRRGIRGMVPLQAAFAAAHGSASGAAFLAAVDIAGRLIGSRRRQGDVT